MSRVPDTKSVSLVRRLFSRRAGSPTYSTLERARMESFYRQQLTISGTIHKSLNVDPWGGSGRPRYRTKMRFQYRILRMAVRVFAPAFA